MYLHICMCSNATVLFLGAHYFISVFLCVLVYTCTLCDPCGVHWYIVCVFTTSCNVYNK